MSNDKIPIDLLVAAARKHPDQLGAILERYQGFLLREGERQLGSQVATRLDADDLVQETFAKAVRNFHQFAGSTEAEFTAWILKIHANSLRDQLRRHLHSEGRAVGHEARLYNPDGNDSCRSLEPAADQSTVSQRVIRAQHERQLEEALERLPEAQREAVRLRHLEGLSIDQIAKRLGRSLSAAAGLVKRGLNGLRDRMTDESR